MNVGDTVQITFMNDGKIIHTWTLDADSPSPYDVSTELLDGGKSDTTTFIADKPGTFTYYCKVSGHRDLGLKGQLVIVAPIQKGPTAERRRS